MSEMLQQKEGSYQGQSKLYIMHTCFSIVSQMWSMGISLFIAAISNNSLFIIACTGFVSNLAAIVLIPYVGHWIDSVDRLVAVHTALAVKIVSITFGLGIFAFLSNSALSPNDGDDYFLVYVIALPLIYASANVGFQAYTLCIEKDWVIELSNGDR